LFVPDRNSKEIYDIDINVYKTKSEDDDSLYQYLIKNIGINGKLTHDELAESLLKPIKSEFKSGMSYDILYTMLQDSCGVAAGLCKEILELIIIKHKLYTAKDKIYSNADEIAKLILMPIKSEIHSGMKKETLRKHIIKDYGVAEHQSKEIMESLIKKLNLYTTEDKIYWDVNELVKSNLKQIKEQIQNGMNIETLRELIIEEYGVPEHQSKDVIDSIKKELKYYKTKDGNIYDRPS
jgi:hypothetical protein